MSTLKLNIKTKIKDRNQDKDAWMLVGPLIFQPAENKSDGSFFVKVNL